MSSTAPISGEPGTESGRAPHVRTYSGEPFVLNLEKYCLRPIAFDAGILFPADAQSLACCLTPRLFAGFHRPYGYNNREQLVTCIQLGLRKFLCCHAGKETNRSQHIAHRRYMYVIPTEHLPKEKRA